MPFPAQEGHLYWSGMQNTRTVMAGWIFVAMVAAVLRLSHLQDRPMHTDEAVHAVKLGTLLESGQYSYDANEYHGPTLNLFTLVPAWLRGQRTLAELNETTLRLIPALFGIGLVLLPLLLAPWLGHSAALAAALLIALSPVQLFYSRYYIQEVLFVFFSFLTLISVIRYFSSPRWMWAAVGGVSLGLMHATKETDILILIAALPATAILGVWNKKVALPRATHLALFMAFALLTSSLFFTAGFTNMQGFIDSFRTYQVYVLRGAGQSLHLYPLDYYLRLLFWFKEPGRPLWSEVWVLPLIVAGLVAAVRPPQPQRKPAATIMRFMTLFTLILCALYSAIPYKTPWNLLAFYYGLLLIAGWGWSWLQKLSKNRTLLAHFLLIVSALLLVRQSWLLNTRYACDPSNPWVYAHPGKDLQQFADAVLRTTAASPDGFATEVEVIVPEADYWPLPWSLRRLANVGWYNQVDESRPPAPIILVTPELEPALMHRLYLLPPPGARALYLNLLQGYFELRPGCEIRGYIRKELKDAVDEHNHQPSAG
jgi:uncharacterized protein (TIGR03663 family)